MIIHNLYQVCEALSNGQWGYLQSGLNFKSAKSLLRQLRRYNSEGGKRLFKAFPIGTYGFIRDVEKQEKNNV